MSNLFDLYPLNTPSGATFDGNPAFLQMKMLGHQADEFFIRLAIYRGRLELRGPCAIIEFDECTGFRVGFYLDLERFHGCVEDSTRR